MYFASDNAAPAAPEVMAALARANEGYAASYGGDEIMARVTDRIRTIFEAPEAAIYLVATGTTANALSLGVLAQPWQAVFCHRHSHVEEDECGAPEFFTGGAKLITLGGADAKIDPAEFRTRAAETGRLGVHNIQRGALTLTNVTELGTLYTVAEISELCGIAHDMGIGTHLDGARFANALAALNCSAADMTWKAGIDVVSFGGTKNGLLGVEAVVIFDPARAWEFELRRKRGGHLFSKHRYLSAQMDAYLEDDLWLRLAAQANAAGARLEEGIKSLPGAHLLHPRGANMLFAGMPRAAHDRARAAGAMYYPWPNDHPAEGPADEDLTCRLVTSWSSTAEEVDAFVDVLRG
ncbi:MAG: beta-eliminating lyase-related protein [Pseudomonadota bacterium]